MGGKRKIASKEVLEETPGKKRISKWSRGRGGKNQNGWRRTYSIFDLKGGEMEKKRLG